MGTEKTMADPCIGYILREPVTPFRKLVILGDTNDPSAITPLILSLPGSAPDLLIHEATDAYIPPQVDYKANRTVETVLEKCVERAHSTPVYLPHVAPGRCLTLLYRAWLGSLQRRLTLRDWFSIILDHGIHPTPVFVSWVS
jgi:hypothetical protein